MARLVPRLARRPGQLPPRPRRVTAGRHPHGKPWRFYAYEDDGNLIARVKNSPTTYYDWDHNNRLKRIRQDGQDPRHHHYTAAGIRDKRTLNGQKEAFHTLSGVALADVRPSGPVAFVQGHQLLGLVKDGDLYHFISDGLGTVRWVTDDAVNPVASSPATPLACKSPVAPRATRTSCSTLTPGPWECATTAPLWVSTTPNNGITIPNSAGG